MPTARRRRKKRRGLHPRARLLLGIAHRSNGEKPPFLLLESLRHVRLDRLVAGGRSAAPMAKARIPVVFISSTVDDLSPYRKAAADAAKQKKVSISPKVTERGKSNRDRSISCRWRSFVDPPSSNSKCS